MKSIINRLTLADKFALAIITACLAIGGLIAMHAHAQSVPNGPSIGLGTTGPRYGVVQSTGFSNALSTATNIAFTVDCRYQKTVTLEFELAQDSANATTYNFPFARCGLDPTGAPRSRQTSLTTLQFATIAAAGTNVISTNIDTYGAGYLYFPYGTNNTGGANVTNGYVRAIIKVSAP